MKGEKNRKSSPSMQRETKSTDKRVSLQKGPPPLLRKEKKKTTPPHQCSLPKKQKNTAGAGSCYTPPKNANQDKKKTSENEED